jgi:serine/threonine-protein kinase
MGTEGGQSPFFSPDGRWLGFFADGRLRKVAIAGGAPVTLADTPEPAGGVWIDREIVFAASSRGGLMRVPAAGGEVRTLTIPREQDGEVRHTWPSVVPDGSVLLFTLEMTPEEESIAAIGAMPFAAGASSRPWRALVGGTAARAGGSDMIVFARGNELQAIALDPVRFATAGEARTVVSGVAQVRGGAQYALSTAGSIIYAQEGPAADAGGLAWWSKAERRDLPEKIRHLRAVRLAPDGTRLAGVRLEGTRADVWVADVERGATTRLTHDGVNSSPVWSADGKAVYFAARTNGAFEIWHRDAQAIAPATRVYSATRHAIPIAASPDGATLAFLQTGEGTRTDIWTLPLNGGAPRPLVLVQGPFDESAAEFSPDFTLCAYQSAESGRDEIHLLRLRDGRRLPVSTEGGERPLWTGDGLYYQSRGRLIRVTIAQNADDLRIATAETVSEELGGTLIGASHGGRFLIDRRTSARSSSAIVSLEWMREVRLLLGPPASALPR